MKKFLVFLIALGVMTSLAFTSFSEDLKIGYVDIFKVFNEYQKTKEYDKTLEARKKDIEKQLEEKKNILEKMQKKLSVIKEEEKAKEQEKIAKVVEEYRELERTGFIDIKKARDEKMKEIIEDINKIIDDYAKKGSFNLIVNENAVLYGDKVMDVTSDILKIANKQHKKSK
ncbi:MAG: OmpH family outer membrane protein [Candidatus Omnitrophica bacterium]|nr:OmpH family outer membrane protein [Candidatus Omnitrophota bacterium]